MKNKKRGIRIRYSIVAPPFKLFVASVSVERRNGDGWIVFTAHIDTAIIETPVERKEPINEVSNNSTTVIIHSKYSGLEIGETISTVISSYNLFSCILCGLISSLIHFH